MPLAVTEACDMRCSHKLGRARPVAKAPFLRIKGKPVLAIGDLSGLTVRRCPNIGPSVSPCRTSLPAIAGASDFVFVNGRRLALAPATGSTDAIPPVVSTWRLRRPGQELVHVAR